MSLSEFPKVALTDISQCFAAVVKHLRAKRKEKASISSGADWKGRDTTGD